MLIFPLQRHTLVFARFLAEMRNDVVGCLEVGCEARLKKHLDSSKKEDVCLSKQERACSAFRIINFNMLTEQAVEKIFDHLQGKIAEFNKTADFPNLLTTLSPDNALRKDLVSVVSIGKRI